MDIVLELYYMSIWQNSRRNNPFNCLFEFDTDPHSEWRPELNCDMEKRSDLSYVSVSVTSRKPLIVLGAKHTLSISLYTIQSSSQTLKTADSWTCLKNLRVWEHYNNNIAFNHIREFSASLNIQLTRKLLSLWNILRKI